MSNRLMPTGLASPHSGRPHAPGWGDLLSHRTRKAFQAASASVLQGFRAVISGDRSAGTLNPHLPQRTIAPAQTLEWLEEPDEADLA
jgi:hypothetical protein